MIGKELRDAREKSGMTQEALSLASGVDRAYISRVENDHKSVSVAVLFRLCDAMGVSASELVARVERARRQGKRK